MLFPTDPNKRPELWRAFANKVAIYPILFIVHASKRLSDEDIRASFDSVEEVVNSFRSTGVVRFGSSQGNAVGPFFGFKLEAGGARLAEYAIDPGLQVASDDAIQEDLQSVAVNLFFERKDISHILLPISLSKWNSDEWQASSRADETVFSRKTSMP